MVGANTEKNFKYDDYENFYSHHYFEPIPERGAFDVHELVPRFGWAFDKIEERAPKNVLDLGCLDGSFCLTVNKHLGIPVTGVDLTVDGINIAKQRAQNNPDIRFFNQTIEDFLEAQVQAGVKYDCITCFEVIEHVKDPGVMLKLIDQCLSPGGFVLISTPDFEDPVYGKDDEQNKCHIRLYTTADQDYKAVNKFGNTRTATSMTAQVGKQRIKEMAVHNHLINCLYE